MADGIVFRTTDMLRWGAAGGLGTGGNLTALQFDEDMWELLTRIQALENDPPVAVSIANFTVIGSQFMVVMTDASTRGPFDLPIATFRLVGEWVNSMPLVKLNIFSAVHFGLFLVLISHTTPAGPATFDPAALDTDPLSPTFGDPLYQILFGEDTYVYDIGFFFPGKPGVGIDAGGSMASHLFVKQVTLPVALAGSQALLSIAPAADLAFPLQKAGTPIGSVDFALGETLGTFTFTTETTMMPGDVLQVIRPTTLDTDARELSLTIQGNRVFG